jgi:hypothetical protein
MVRRITPPKPIKSQLLYRLSYRLGKSVPLQIPAMGGRAA